MVRSVNLALARHFNRRSLIIPISDCLRCDILPTVCSLTVGTNVQRSTLPFWRSTNSETYSPHHCVEYGRNRRNF
jgi:hypothetical protein